MLIRRPVRLSQSKEHYDQYQLDICCISRIVGCVVHISVFHKDELATVKPPYSHGIRNGASCWE
jgi:hypothetical protein